MADTLNYTLILVLLPLVVALVLRLAAALVKSKSQKLKDYSMTALCEYGFTATMFVMYHMAIGLSLQLMYFKTSEALFAVNIADCAIVVGNVVLMVVLYKVKPEHFGDYRKEFKPDALSQHYYLLIMGGRVILSVLLVAMNSIQAVGLVAMAIPLAGIILLAVRKPYLRGYNNYRAIMN
jgi:hypothetical protein